MNRGDVILVRFPHASGTRGKKRPAVVVQADVYMGVVGTVVVAEITGNLAVAGDPACLFVDVSTPEGKATGPDSRFGLVLPVACDGGRRQGCTGDRIAFTRPEAEAQRQPKSRARHILIAN